MKIMWNWLLNNKTWLFSGIGIVILIYPIIFLSKFLISKFFKKKKSITIITKDQSLTEIPEGQPIKTAEIKSGSLTVDAILTAIYEAPLLQQADIIKHYTGLSVIWDGKLVNAEKKSDKLVRLHILIAGEKHSYVSVMVEIMRSQYPTLGLLKEDHLIRVSGIISNIQRNYFVLKDARIEYKLASQHNR